MENDITANRERLRVGVIGTGYGANVHIPALKHLPDVDVVAVCARHVDHAMRSAREHGIPEHFSDYRTMLDRCELDAVTVAVPPSQQHPIVISCAEYGIHILCEKPMGSSAAEARDMHRLVDDAGIVHAINFQSRYLPIRMRLKELIDKGFIGELESVSVSVYRAPWRQRRSEHSNWIDDGERSSGLVNAVGSEYVDVLRWCFGEFEGVSGLVSYSPSQRDVPNVEQSSFSIVMRFTSGGAGTVHVAGAARAHLGEEIVASGEDGMLVVQSDGKLFGCRRDAPRMEEIALPQYDDQDMAALPHPKMLPFIVLANDWVRRILGRGESTVLPTFYDGMKVQEVLHGVKRSERLSRWIDLSEKKWPVQRS